MIPWLIIGVLAISLIIYHRKYGKLKHLWKSADGGQRRLDEKFRRKQRALRHLEDRHALSERDRKRLGRERDEALDELHEALGALHEAAPHIHPPVPVIGQWIKNRYGWRARTLKTKSPSSVLAQGDLTKLGS